MESSLLACSSLDPSGVKKVSWSKENPAGARKAGKAQADLPDADVTYGDTQRGGDKPLAHKQALPGDELLGGHCTGNRDGFAKFCVDAEQKLVTVRFGKTVTARDIERYAAQLRDFPTFSPDFSEIADIRDVEMLDLNAEEFIRLADRIDPFSDQAKRAFVVRSSVQAHAARMHKILRTQRSFEIFYSLEEAEQWISSQT